VESTKDTRIFRDKNFVGFERLHLSNVYQIQSVEFKMCSLSNAFTEFQVSLQWKVFGENVAVQVSNVD
jgi:hypothetical protein